METGYHSPLWSPVIYIPPTSKIHSFLPKAPKSLIPAQSPESHLLSQMQVLMRPHRCSPLGTAPWVQFYDLQAWRQAICFPHTPVIHRITAINSPLKRGRAGGTKRALVHSRSENHLGSYRNWKVSYMLNLKRNHTPLFLHYPLGYRGQIYLVWDANTSANGNAQETLML